MVIVQEVAEIFVSQLERSSYAQLPSNSSIPIEQRVSQAENLGVLLADLHDNSKPAIEALQATRWDILTRLEQVYQVKIKDSEYHTIFDRSLLGLCDYISSRVNTE